MSMDVYEPPRVGLVAEAAKARRERMTRLSMNAVPDAGIDLRRGPKPIPAEARPSRTVIPFPINKMRPVTIWLFPDESLCLEGDAPRIPPLTIDRIIQTVCQFYGLSKAEILSSLRPKTLARKRQIICYLARTLTDFSQPHIGRRLDRDHTTVLHAVRVIGALRLNDADLDADLTTLIFSLTGEIGPHG